MSNHFAVMGNPVSHSLSPLIHQDFARQADISLLYEKILGDNSHFESQVGDFFNQGGKGLNITLPFKTRAFSMAMEQTTRCAEAHAANTLWMEEGKLYADNTDGIGLIRDLSHHIELANKKILLLGAGGAARGVIGPLLASAITTLTLVNRTFEKTRDLKKDFPAIYCANMNELDSDYDVIINATSASLNGNESLLTATLLKNRPFCYDLSYRQGQLTPFVAMALEEACEAMDGLGMLVEQAAESFYIWLNFKPDTTDILKKLRLIFKER